MNRDIVEGNWTQIKGKAISLWGTLTDDRFVVVAGERIERAGREQAGYGITKDEADQQLRAFGNYNRELDPK